MSKLSILYYYLRYRNRLRFRTREDVLRYQQRQIEQHLHYLTSHSPFYASLRGESLSQFPVMNKQMMMEHFTALNTVGFDRDEAMEFALEAERARTFSPKLHGITVGLSSGTSHSRGLFVLSDAEKNQWAGYVLACCLPEGLHKRQRIAFFMRANSNLYEAVGSSWIQFRFYDIYQDMEEHIKNLQEEPPDILVGQPSVLLALAEASGQGALSLRPRRVISIAEVLEGADAEVLKSVFAVPVIHQVYQCTEGCLGLTCDHGTLHLNEDIVHIDQEPLGERRFVPIVTDFTRKSQPILRYRLNDILVERAEPCPCGLPFTAIEKIEGREDDVFIFRGEQEGKSVCIFPDFIRRCILFAGEITQYRVLQEQDASLHVYANISESLCRQVKAEFEQLAKERNFVLPTLSFHPYHYDAARKLKRVESLFPKGEKQ